MTHPLLADVGFLADTPQAEQILEGTYTPPPRSGKVYKSNHKRASKTGKHNERLGGYLDLDSRTPIRMEDAKRKNNE